MSKKYNFEYEGSKTIIDRIWRQLEQQYQDMLSYAEKYNLTIDESLDSFDKFVELFDSEYYTDIDSPTFKPCVIDYTLYVSDVISEDTVVFLPKSLANKYNKLELSQHYFYPTDSYFDALIGEYTKYYHLLDDVFGEWLLLDIENFIQSNSQGKKVLKDYLIATRKKQEREESEKIKKANFIKQLRINLRENKKALDEEDIEILEEMIEKYSK